MSAQAAARTTRLDGVPVLEHVLSLTDLGPRLIGSPAANAAARSLAAVLAGAGWTVRMHRQPWPSWTDRGSTVEIANQVLPATTGTFSPPGDIIGRVRVVEQGDSLADLDTAGRIVVLLTQAGTSPLPAARALSSGAYPELDASRDCVTALRVSGAAALIVGSLGARHGALTLDPDLPMPHVTVSAGTADALSRATRARVRVRTVREPGASLTVSALSPGAGPEDPRVVLHAHLDSAATSAGMLDNASGVGVVLAATARLSGGAAPAIEIVFSDGGMFWSSGLAGYLGERRTTSGMLGCVDVDRVGCRDTPTTVACAGRPVGGDRWEAIGGWDVPWLRPGVSDGHGGHRIFRAHAVPCVSVGCVGRPPGDDEDPWVLDPHRLERTASFVAQLAQRMGGGPG